MSWINNNAGSIVAANSPFLPLPEDNMQTELQQLFTNGATGFMVAFGLIVAIGAQNAWVLNKSLRGEHPWVITAVCVAIDITLISVGVLTISQIQQWLPPLIPAVTLFGVLFLCWLSAQAFYRAWLGGAGLATSNNSQLSSPWRSAGQACAISLLNPHVYLDTVILIGSIGAQQSAPLWFIAGAGSASALWFSSLAAGGRWLRPYLTQPRHWQWLELMTGLCLLVVALLLLQRLW